MKNHLLHHLQAVCMLVILSMLSIPETFAAGPTSQQINDAIVDPTSVPLTWENDPVYPWTLVDGALKSGNAENKESESSVTFSFSSAHTTKVFFNYSAFESAYMYIYLDDKLLTKRNYVTNEQDSVRIGKGTHKIKFTTKIGYYSNQTSFGQLNQVRVIEYTSATQDEINQTIVQEGSVPLQWTNDPRYPWYMADGKLKSGNWGINKSNSSISFTYDSKTPTSIQIGYNMSSYNSNYFKIKVDGEEAYESSYNQTDEIEYRLTQGRHTITISDSIPRTSSEEEYAEINFIKVTPIPSATIQQINDAIVDKESLPLNWTMDEEDPWLITDGKVRNGNWGIKSHQSELSFTFENQYPSTFSINYQLNESWSNYFKIYIDGNLEEETYGTTSVKDYQYHLTRGKHVITLCDSVVKSSSLTNYAIINAVKVTEFPGASIQTISDSTINSTNSPITWTNDPDFAWGYVNGVLKTSNAEFPNTESSLKSEITLTQPAIIKFKYRLSSYHSQSDALSFLVNGTVYELKKNKGTWNSAQAYLNPGKNTLEWRHSNKYSDKNNYAELKDLEFYGTNIEVTTTPGKLGVELLRKAESLEAVELLKVNGTLNDDDWMLFMQLPNLCAVNLENTGGTPMKYSPFRDCPNLESINLPRNLTIIDDGLLEYTKLKQITIPASVTSIGERAFSDCKYLETVSIPENSQIQNISYEAFYGCTKLREFIMPQSVTTLGTRVFNGCASLQKLVFSEALTLIPDYTCSGNKSLTTVNLPKQITSIGAYAFKAVPLTKIDIPEKVTFIDNHAFYGTDIDSLMLPAGLTDLGHNAFSANRHLKFVQLPSHVTTYLNQFSDCDSIKTVVCIAVNPPITENSFDLFQGLDKNSVTLKVPAFSLNSYKLDKYWYQFGHIEAMDTAPTLWTIDSDFVYFNDTPLTIQPSINLIETYNHKGTMTVTGKEMLSAKDFSLVWNYHKMYEEYDSLHLCALVNESQMRADQIKVKQINPSNKWTFFTIPFDVQVSDILAQKNTDWVIHSYDGAARAAGNLDITWTRLQPTDLLKAGQGYIIQSKSYEENGRQMESSEFTFQAVNNDNKNRFFANGDVTVKLNAYPANASHNRGWNLTGNPYPCFYDTRFMDFKAPITCWNIENSTYIAYSPLDDSYILLPGESFFLQCPVDQDEVTFSAEGRQPNRIVRNMDNLTPLATNLTQPRYVINLRLTDGKTADRTRIVLNENAETGYEMDKDAHKFMSLNSDVAQLYTSQGQTPYSINERPLDNGQVELNVHTGKPGWYTLSVQAVPAGVNLLLEDKLQGTRQSLSPERPYCFDAQPADHPDRFVLYFTTEVTGIDTVEDTDPQPQNLYDLKGKKVNTPTGQGIYIDNGKKVLLNK